MKHIKKLACKVKGGLGGESNRDLASGQNKANVHVWMCV